LRFVVGVGNRLINSCVLQLASQFHPFRNGRQSGGLAASTTLTALSPGVSKVVNATAGDTDLTCRKVVRFLGMRR
jgi:hypothetical protein